MQFLAPPLARALELGEGLAAGDAPASNLPEVVDQALAFVQEGVQLYQLLSPGILRSDASLELMRQIELEQQAQREGLEALRKAAGGQKVPGLQRLLGSARQASERLLELFARLQEAEVAERAYSPFPALDHFLKVGINHLNRKVDAFEVQTRVATVAGLVAGLGQDVERFRALYGREDLANACQEPLQGMQAGLGAVALYLADPQQRQALEDGLKLLGANGQKMAEELQRLDAHLSSLPGTGVAYLRDLRRALEVGEPWLTQAVQVTRQALGFYTKELAQAHRSPLFFEVEGAWKEASELLAGVPLEPTVADAADWLKRHGDGVARLDEAVGKVRAQINLEAQKFAQAPHVAAVRELVGRALAGDISQETLRAALAEQKERHGKLLEQLQDASDPLSQELAQLVSSHGMAFVRMGLFLEDGDRQHLIQGWKLISLTCSRILELSEQLRAQMKPRKGSGPKQVVCFRCGAENTGTDRMCRSCGGALPQMSQEVTEYTEITSATGPEEYTMPANLAQLEMLAGQVEAGDISRDELAEALDELLKKADKVRNAFEKNVIALMGKDSTFDAYAQFFAIRMGQYVQGVVQMRSFAEGGSLNHLLSGLAACREAAEELQGFQDLINEALRGQ